MREMLRTLDEAPMPLARLCPRLARGLPAVVDRLMARSPDARFACPEDALRALGPFGAGELGSLRLASLVRLVTDAGGHVAT
jgi:hypothetical protein